MSVTTTTPSPWSTAATAASTSACFEPQSSSASIATAAVPGLLADHMLHRCEILAGQAAMRDNNNSDHAVPIPTRSGGAGRTLQVPVPNRHPPTNRRKRFRQRLDHRDRPVPAAGAAEARLK